MQCVTLSGFLLFWATINLDIKRLTKMHYIHFIHIIRWFEPWAAKKVPRFRNVTALQLWPTFYEQIFCWLKLKTVVPKNIEIFCFQIAQRVAGVSVACLPREYNSNLIFARQRNRAMTLERCWMRCVQNGYQYAGNNG